MIKPYAFFILFLLSYGTHAIAQNASTSEISTVLRRISEMKDDTNKVNAYFLRENSSINQNENAPEIYKEAWELAKKIGFLKGMGKADFYSAVWYNDRANYIKALDHARKALEEAEYVSKQNIIQVLFFTRWVHRGLQNFNKAIEFDIRALKLAGLQRNDTLVCAAYLALANDYGDLNKYQVTIFFAKKALPIAEKLNHPGLKSTVFSELSWVYYSTKNYLPAYRYSLKARQTERENGLNSANTLKTLGEIYRDAPDSLLLKMGISPDRRSEKVLDCFKKSLADAETSHILSSIADNFLNISRSYAGIYNYKEAYFAYRNHILYRDSTANEKQQRMLIQNQASSREQSLKYEQELAFVKARQMRNYYAVGIAVLLLVSFVISRSYIKQRNYNNLLSVANTQISLEKTRSDDLLLNILPADVAEELKERGSANARLFEEVTVLFTDFVDFTIVSELLTPQELVDELNACFTEFDTIITSYGIEKIKTIGDAYLAVSGLPNSDPRHAIQAVKAGLAIRRFVQNRKQTYGSKTFNVRIGIHSGSVVAGIVGSKKFAYDVWGDTVNTAARMEQNSEPGKINISKKTSDLLNDEFSLVYRGEIIAKNKGAMQMYFVSDFFEKV